MRNHGVHLITVAQCRLQFLVLLFNNPLSSHERNLLHHTHHQFFLVEGLRQEVAGAHLEAMHQILWCIQCRQKNDGYIGQLRVLLHDDSRIETIDVGHHHVKKNQVGMLCLGLLDTCLTAVRRAYLELLICQQYFQQQHIAHYVVDNQNFIVAPVDF